jgi:ankyrin repeat protein
MNANRTLHEKIDGKTPVDYFTFLFINDRTLFLNKDVDNNYPFYLASSYKQYEYLMLSLIKQFPNSLIDQNKYKKKDNVIHRAVICGSYSVVDYLITFDNKYYANVTDYKGDTALHVACANKQYDIIERLLLSDDIIVNKKNYDGQTPLHLYMINQCNNIHCLKIHNGEHTR